jgi:hypothetical protein
VVHLGGGKRHTKDLPGSAPGRRCREDLREGTLVPVAAVTWGRSRRRLRNVRILGNAEESRFG